MANTIQDIRQHETRVLQDQIDSAAVTRMDSVLASVNNELTPPGRLIAQTTPTLVVSVNSGTVTNPNTSKKRVLPFINNVPVAFTGGTITFPSTSGTVTVSPGTNATITIGASQFVAVLVQLDSAGQLNIIVGAAAASLGAVVIPSGATSALSLGYIIVQSDASSIIQPVTNAMLYQFVGGGGSGGGSGGEIERDLDSLNFRAVFCDEFTEAPTAAGSAVLITAARTTATYSANGGVKPTGGGYYQMSYDASLTVTGSGVNMTMSGTPAYTVVAGDMLVVTGEARRIVTVTSQTVYVLEAAFTVTPSPSATATCVSQAVHTRDIYNLVLGDNSIATAFPGTTFGEILVDYEDAPGSSTVSDLGLVPAVAYTAAQGGASYTSVKVRPTLETDTLNSTMLNAPGSGLFLRFFANKTSGSGSVDLLRYEAYMQKISASGSASASFGVLTAAYGFTNGVGTPYNCTFGVAAGKTTVTLTNGFTYAVGVTPGSPYGSLDVYVNGQLIPRFINSTLTPDASYLETSPSVITLDKDYSALNIAVEILQRTSVIDSASQNVSDISSMKEIFQNGFQGFTAQNLMMNPTTSVGAPSAGLFYSSILSRAAIVDLSQDLKVRMARDRIQIQQIYEMQGEYGPNNEQVWGAANDYFGQFRFVGAWTNVISNYGFAPQSSANTTDFVEVTFYGTGLNILHASGNAAYDARASVDGGAEGSNIFGAVTTSGILIGRNMASNQVYNVAANLSLGVHTVKIRNNSGSLLLTPYGFEIVNESTNVKVNPGVSYINGQKYAATTQASFAPNTSFESGTLGVRGGRVLVYQKSDGTIAKSVRPVDAASAVLTAADHTNEEPTRPYYPKDFGFGRTDDFSVSLSGSNSLAATLDDNNTTLSSNAADTLNGNAFGAVLLNANATFISITFTGTGLDFVRRDSASGGADSYNAQIDGGATNALTSAGITTPTLTKIVSGLPYGTHVVRINRVTAATFALGIVKFIVYQPKKPTLPAGAVEIADYNIPATFVANATASFSTIATGVIKKNNVREFVYVGAGWTIGAGVGTFQSGYQVQTGSSGDYYEYTFFGTGFDARFRTRGATSTTQVLVSLQSISTGGALSAFTTANFGAPATGGTTYGAIGAFNATTGIFSLVAAGATNGVGFYASGLPLGLYKIRITNNNGSGAMDVDGLDEITPIHSTKSNLFIDLQNTLPVGSCSITDNRKVTPVKDFLPSNKAWVQAIGVSATPTTTSSVDVAMPDMALMIRTFGNSGIEIDYRFVINQSAGGTAIFVIYVDGIPLTGVYSNVISNFGSTINLPVTDNINVPCGPGNHRVELFWNTNAGTLSINGTRRILKAREL